MKNKRIVDWDKASKEVQLDFTKKLKQKFLENSKQNIKEFKEQDLNEK